jgi:hypothetical protein
VSLCRCNWRKASAGAHRLLSSDRWPIVSDFVEDRVFSPMLSALLVVMIFFYVSRVGLFPVFLTHPIVEYKMPQGLLSLDTSQRSSTVCEYDPIMLSAHSTSFLCRY